MKRLVKRLRAIEYWLKFHNGPHSSLLWRTHITGPASGGSVWCSVKLCMEQESVGAWQAFKMVRRYAIVYGVKWRRKLPSERIENYEPHRAYIWVQP